MTSAPYKSGNQLMTYPHVRRAIAQRRKHFFKDTSATIERLVAELQLMAFYDIGDIFDDNDRLLRVREIAPAIRRTVKKVKVRRCPHEGEGGGIDEIIEIEMADKQAREGGGSRERSSEEAYSQTALARQSMPHDVEAERAILGAILLDNDNIEKVGQLTWNDFYFQGHQLIYTAMEDLRRARNPIDAHTLTHELKTRGKLEAVGSYAYLAELASSPPWTLNVEHWAKNVHDLAEKRRIAAEMAHFHEMASNGVTLEALRGEMDRRLTPIISGNEDESLPTVFIRNKIEVTGLRELRARRESHSYTWIVNGWLARGQTSMWAGKVEHGKTTLMRELALCVARGEPFLGRETVKGRVFYAMLDADGEDLTFDEFAKMGVNDDEENIMFMFEPMLASMNRGVDQFFKALYERHPALVIIDPVARLRQVKDFNDYSHTYLMGELSQRAKDVDAHFALPAHIPRNRASGAEAATASFGSIAFAAGVNARFVVERKEGTNIHVLRTSKGKSAGFEAIEGEVVLEQNPATGRLSLGGPFRFKDQASAVKEEVFRFLQSARDEEEFSPTIIARELHMQGITPSVVRLAGNLLHDEHRIGRVGNGRKGSPYLFKKAVDTGVPEERIEPDRQRWLWER